MKKRYQQPKASEVFVLPINLLANTGPGPDDQNNPGMGARQGASGTRYSEFWGDEDEE